MNQDVIPSKLARAALRALPPAVLQRTLDGLMRRMERRHPRLFKNLKRLDPCVLFVAPSDVTHAFVLTFGGTETSLHLAESPKPACNAAIRGSLDALLNLLEGRIDGDTLFFARDIEISGDTAAVVALRNTLDREEIDLLRDITYGLGPFARPAREAILFLDTIAQHVRQRLNSRRTERASAQ